MSIVSEPGALSRARRIGAPPRGAGLSWTANFARAVGLATGHTAGAQTRLPGPMSQVFVSYSRKDSDAVEPMKQALRRAGFSVGPDAASAGDDFGEQLRRGLEAAQCVIVIW